MPKPDNKIKIPIKRSCAVDMVERESKKSLMALGFSIHGKDSRTKANPKAEKKS